MNKFNKIQYLKVDFYTVFSTFSNKYTYKRRMQHKHTNHPISDKVNRLRRYQQLHWSVSVPSTQILKFAKRSLWTNQERVFHRYYYQLYYNFLIPNTPARFQAEIGNNNVLEIQKNCRILLFLLLLIRRFSDMNLSSHSRSTLVDRSYGQSFRK